MRLRYEWYRTEHDLVYMLSSQPEQQLPAITCTPWTPGREINKAQMVLNGGDCRLHGTLAVRP